MSETWANKKKEMRRDWMVSEHWRSTRVKYTDLNLGQDSPRRRTKQKENWEFKWDIDNPREFDHFNEMTNIYDNGEIPDDLPGSVKVTMGELSRRPSHDHLDDLCNGNTN